MNWSFTSHARPVFGALSVLPLRYPFEPTILAPP